ncbi:hypothetical protein SAMD00079811_44450 [Scytonema sp. HK-05]|nr:hypothetical protein SAMD00079811_44450 [Scytonema sp. HK-05]
MSLSLHKQEVYQYDTLPSQEINITIESKRLQFASLPLFLGIHRQIQIM